MSDHEMSTAYAMMSTDCYECPDGPVFEESTVATKQTEAPEAPEAQATVTVNDNTDVRLLDVQPSNAVLHTPTYRQKQRFVKWMRENDYWRSSHKNVGTDNVNANVEEILDSERFWKLMQRPDLVASLNTFVGYDVV